MTLYVITPLKNIFLILKYIVRKLYCMFYKEQIISFNHTVHHILTKEISLIFPNFPKDRKEKRSVITSLITGFIGLAYEGISHHLHNKRQKALHKTFIAMENKINLQHNKLFIWKIQWLCMVFIIQKLWKN